jgi:serine phosphatase RsbU (regulator of sigma subunit)
MAELWYSLRAYVHEGHHPSRVLELLNGILVRDHPELTATVCTLTFPPGRDTVTVTNAGHIPPLLLRDDGYEYLEGGGTLLGAQLSPPPSTVFDFQSGHRLVLMTDGIVERRRTCLEIELTRVASRLLSAPDVSSLDALCRATILAQSSREDDAAIVFVERET